jgi:nicotinamide-nucleotide amidase
MAHAESGRQARAGLATEIVTTGTEILLGDIVDTNAAWMAQQLRDAGINLYYKTTVGDNEARLRAVLELGLTRSDAILVSGGLGPTADDITRQAIAAATGRALVKDARAEETLRARFARFGVEMTENNLQQAFLPEGATLIENPVGTAPGFIVETEAGAIIAMPGVPREMKQMMTAAVLPYLQARAGDIGVIRRRILRTIGIGESMIDSRLRDLMAGANPTVGLAAHAAQADVRIAARAGSSAEADALLDALEADIRARIGETIYSTEPDESIEAAVARLLQARACRVSILESNTAGRVAARMMASTMDYRAVRSAWVVDDPALPQAVRERARGVSTPTEEQARLAAEAVRIESESDYALALLGTAGADEGVFGASQGQTWIGLASAVGSSAVLCPFGGREEYTVIRIGNQALGTLWKELRNSS